MMRAGSTVQYHLAASLVEESGLGKRGGHFTDHTLPTFLKAYQPSNQITVIKCHEYVPAVAEVAQRDQVKAIYVYRDIRDVVVSMMNREQKSFYRVVRHLPKSQIKQFYQWTRQVDVLVSIYETMYCDLTTETERIAAFLGISIGREVAQTIAQQYSVEQQRRRIKDFDYQNQGITDSLGYGMYNPHNHLHIHHINGVEPQQWQKQLSSWQIALVEVKAYTWLLECGYGISQPYFKRLLARILYMPVEILGAVYSYIRRKWSIR
jgi:hypothetical protein